MVVLTSVRWTFTGRRRNVGLAEFVEFEEDDEEFFC
jgi:hypothetical protein